MGKKHSYEYVKSKIESYGYTLLEKEYETVGTKMKMMCPKKHVIKMRFKDLNKGHRCVLCSGKSKKTYEFIKSEFEKEGYQLLSSKYVNAHSKLDYICTNGHRHSIKWVNWSAGNRCLYCYGNNKKTYEEVKEIFEKEGYSLLSKKYVNSKSKLKFVCPNGHTHYITLNDFNNGYRCGKCFGPKGDYCHSWKGGVIKLDLPLYDTYANQLKNCEKIYLINKNNLPLLGVRCLYCNKIFIPTRKAVKLRIRALSGKSNGEARFYCSDNCKKACPTYGQHKYPKGFKTATSREVQPELRKLVLERDDWQCQKCPIIDAELHCHHIDPVSQNPIESADIDNCITLCKKCHKEVHKQPNCNFNDLKCKK